MGIASANRDEAVFENADQFDITRTNNRHVAFGLGHFQGVVAGFGIKLHRSLSSQSWLFSHLFGNKTSQIICFILFLITGLFGIATALSFKDIIISVNYWQTLAVLTAILSTLCLVFYWNSFAMFFNKVGAIAVNLLIYYSILLNNQWPTAIFEN